jgi:hypothetical protein
MKLEKREFGTKSNSREQSAQPVKTPMDAEEHVRRRAYELYEERGKVDGFEVEDWLQAEAELQGTGRTNRAA